MFPIIRGKTKYQSVFHLFPIAGRKVAEMLGIFPALIFYVVIGIWTCEVSGQLWRVLFELVVADSSCIDASVLWELCNALWGSVMSDDDDMISETGYECQLARREAVSHWLTACAADNIYNDIQSADAKVVIAGLLLSFISFSGEV